MGGADEAAEGMRRLYPFLRGPGEGTAGERAELEEQAVRSTVTKAGEILRLRAQVGEMHAERLAACARDMAGRFAAGGRLFTFGNGGSSTDAQEVATLHLRPRFGRPLPALALTSDVAVVTALSNDVGFDVVFARQIAALARPGDIAFGLSTSGGSANLVQAFEEARGRGLLTIGLAGYQGGRFAELAELDVLDHLFVIPSTSVHRIQEAQTTIYHVLWEVTQHLLDGPAAPVAGQVARPGAKAPADAGHE
ncbi:phosphoheptose isomerase [Sphaerisporangium melleum]|uniref:Phosphoheptose isomerase n=1 Tax=Sphaerisporangium melleum TaxID=321316 RepID=A0A917VFR4_9ACTN|nr:SIS domain-containing protein [Sphaerisporangium melleum]GGK75922.1 phosphoheptose isomerase [Sphaerisporangium melleum]GII72688.1 phosphoheptose isomerase [Sphaerisporangium melleum]